METKKIVNGRWVTGDHALVYTRFASKALFFNLVTPKQRKQYFEAIKVLRDIADEHCKMLGIDIDSIKIKIVFE